MNAKPPWMEYAEKHPDVLSLIETKVASLFPEGKFSAPLVTQFLDEACVHPDPNVALLMASVLGRRRKTYEGGKGLVVLPAWAKFVKKYAKQVLAEFA